MISVVNLESNKGKAAPMKTERVCMRAKTIDPNMKIANLFSLDENTVTKMKVYK